VADWVIGWYNDTSHHRHSTFAPMVLGSEQVRSSEHSNF
jgi:hypothetical protein